MTPRILLAIVLAMAVVAAWARLILWQRADRTSSGSATPGRIVWRLLLLMAAQPVIAAVLFLALFPPGTPVAGDVLRIAPRGTPATAASAEAGPLMAMPEAGTIVGAERVPDLGTALRHHPTVRRIIVLGQGLTARDRDAARGLGIAFAPSPPLPGLIALSPPARVAPGASFSVGGQVVGLRDAAIDLVDPAGRVTDTQKPDASGYFTVTGTARAAGLTTFALRLRDGQRLVEQAEVPVRVETDSPPRLLIMAGAPGPEVKYLRRWATDAGFAVTTQMSAGGGIQLGDPVIAITAASLRQFDAAIIDERSWAGLGSSRDTMIGAARGGLGLVLRTGGPLDGPSREAWRSLGFAMTGGDTLVPIALPSPSTSATEVALARTRSGIGSADTPADADIGEPILPEINRLAAQPGGSDVVPLVRDEGGAVLSAWRATGLGRIAVFTGIDSYGLTLTGHRDLYADWWSGIMSTIARPANTAPPAFSGTTWVGDRVVLCGLTGDAQVGRPDDQTTTILTEPGLTEPSGGCAAFWPVVSGWHLLRSKAPDGNDRTWPFFVHPADSLTGVHAAQDRDATLLMQGPPADIARPDGEAATTLPGPSWPWLIAWLVLSAALWAFERSRFGKGEPPVPRPADAA